MNGTSRDLETVERSAPGQDALLSLATAERLLEGGDAAQAQLVVRDVLRSHPEEPRALYLAGRLERLAGRFEPALELLERAAGLAPEHVETHLELAVLFRRARDFERSLDELANVLYYQPENAEAYFELGSVHRLRGDFKRAIAYFRRAIEADPAHARAHVELGWLYLERERFAEGVEVLEKAAELDPRSILGQNNLGYAYVRLEEYDRALATFAKLCANTPRSVLWPRLNLGNALDHTGRFEESERIYEQILRYEPNNFAARWNRAHIQLCRHEYAEGWRGYAYRLQAGAWHPRLIPFEPWQGQPLEGKTLLVSAEQGLGDQIMFASCLHELIGRASNIILECDSRLQALFARSFPEVRVIGSRHETVPPWLQSAGDADFHVPAGSVPGFLRNTLQDFPRHRGYLQADPGKVARWKARLAELGPGLKVGLSWRGGTRSTRRILRSLTLTDLLPILRTAGCTFVSLQYGECLREIEELKAESGIEIRHWQEAIDDYDETAALCMALDMSVSVCTAVIHLNGALGRPVWIMVPAVPEWRYGRTAEHMPWYPSARLFRQQVRSEWLPVIETLAVELGRRAAGG